MNTLPKIEQVYYETTLLASEMLNRRWIGIEIGKEYHTLAVNRLAPLMKQTRFKGSMEDN